MVIRSLFAQVTDDISTGGPMTLNLGTIMTEVGRWLGTDTTHLLQRYAGSKGRSCSVTLNTTLTER